MAPITWTWSLRRRPSTRSLTMSRPVVRQGADAMTVLEGNTSMIDRKEASAALSEINEMVQRVRQSRIYDLASQFMIVAGIFVIVGNLANFVAPHYGAYIWPTINVMTIAVSAFVSTFDYRRTRVRSFDLRIFVALVFFYAFGVFCTSVLGHYGPREMGT